MIISSLFSYTIRLQIYDPVSFSAINSLFLIFQTHSLLSAVPAPEINTPYFLLDQSIALIAALWLFLKIGKSIFKLKTISQLSFPPEAK